MLAVVGVHLVNLLQQLFRVLAVVEAAALEVHTAILRPFSMRVLLEQQILVVAVAVGLQLPAVLHCQVAVLEALES